MPLGPMLLPHLSFVWSLLSFTLFSGMLGFLLRNMGAAGSRGSASPSLGEPRLLEVAYVLKSLRLFRAPRRLCWVLLVALPCPSFLSLCPTLLSALAASVPLLCSHCRYFFPPVNVWGACGLLPTPGACPPFRQHLSAP